jgi:hypothetical protein
LFTREGKHLTALVGELETKLKEAAVAEREIFEQVAERDESFRETTATARHAEENLSVTRARHAENALRRDRAEREFLYQREQIENLEKRSAVLRGETGATEQRLKLAETEIERLQADEKKDRAEAERSEIICGRQKINTASKRSAARSRGRNRECARGGSSARDRCRAAFRR